MNDLKNIHIKLTHYTEDGKLITIPWIPATYKNTNKGKEVNQPGHWLAFLHLPNGSTEPCRIPVRLIEQRTREDKTRASEERKEADKQFIIAAKVSKAQGFGL
jgi:hypothetical protein